ncbi:GAP family protein [Halostreptopolyspora alba]|uniref:GAP family protein n=1 Tax=Halostreptopolyspora alba TaxID=2487137 RepID=A0A3N0EGE5_9ACTN|nr:GAP family protein [Nocardiopsaceae bacterium YIM 96095]
MSPEILIPIGGLALLDTLSPAVLGVTLFVLLSGNRRTALPLFAYLLTVALFYFSAGVGLMLGLGSVISRLGNVGDHPVVLWGQALLGAALLGYSFVMPTRPTAGARRREPRSFRVPTMIGLGVTTGVFEIGTALPYLAAIGIMSTAELPAAWWVPLLAGYTIVMVLPPALMYLAHRILGERMRPRLQRWREKVTSGSRETLAWIIGIAGFLLLSDAVGHTGIPDFIDGLDF